MDQVIDRLIEIFTDKDFTDYVYKSYGPENDCKICTEKMKNMLMTENDKYTFSEENAKRFLDALCETYRIAYIGGWEDAEAHLDDILYDKADWD